MGEGTKKGTMTAGGPTPCRTLRFFAGAAHACTLCAESLADVATIPAAPGHVPQPMTSEQAKLYAKMWEMVGEYLDGLGRGSIMLSADIGHALEQRLRSYRSTENKVLVETAEGTFESMTPMRKEAHTSLLALLDEFKADIADGLLTCINKYRPSAADIAGAPRALDLPPFQARLAGAMLEAEKMRAEEALKALEFQGERGRVAAWNDEEERRKISIVPQVCKPPPPIPLTEWVFVSAPIIVFAAAACWLAAASADVVLSRGVM